MCLIVNSVLSIKFLIVKEQYPVVNAVERRPHCQPGSLHIPHDTNERHSSSVTFKNIWSEEFLIVYRCVSLIPSIFFSLSLSFSATLRSCPPPVPFLSKEHTHTNPHAWTLIWLVQSVQGQGRALMEKFVQLISGGLEMQDSSLSLCLCLSCNLSRSLFSSPFCCYFVSSGWICIFWIRVKARKKRKTKDIAALSMGSQLWREKKKNFFYPRRKYLGWLGSRT